MSFTNWSIIYAHYTKNKVWGPQFYKQTIDLRKIGIFFVSRASLFALYYSVFYVLHSKDLVLLLFILHLKVFGSFLTYSAFYILRSAFKGFGSALIYSAFYILRSAFKSIRFFPYVLCILHFTFCI